MSLLLVLPVCGPVLTLMGFTTVTGVDVVTVMPGSAVLLLPLLLLLLLLLLLPVTVVVGVPCSTVGVTTLAPPLIALPVLLGATGAAKAGSVAGCCCSCCCWP